VINMTGETKSTFKNEVAGSFNDTTNKLKQQTLKRLDYTPRGNEMSKLTSPSSIQRSVR